MTSGDLANPPLIDTDLPTSDVYYNQTPRFFNNGSIAGDTAGNDTSRPISTYFGTSAMISMANVPNSFAKNTHRKGIIGAFLTLGYDGSISTRLAMHQPTGSVKGFTTGWDVIPGVGDTIGAQDANISYVIDARVASQRQGEFAYAFNYLHRAGLFTTTDVITVSKVTRDEYVQFVALAGGGQTLVTGNNTAGTIPVISVIDGQFFVSDEAEPFIWNVAGSIQSGGTVKMSGFRDDSSGNIGYYYTYYDGNAKKYLSYWYGQSTAFYQEFTAPADVHGFGPYIVHPWSAGNYNPPELWYFIKEYTPTGFETTGRFKIYRSRWTKGVYTKPASVTFADDDDFKNGVTQFPKLNPLGYGWETDVFNDEHLVGIVGPFSGMTVYNEKSNYLATQQNANNTGAPIGTPPNNPGGSQRRIMPFGFTVVRDKKRYNTMHIVALDGGVEPNDGVAASLNRIWFANSADDGATWSSMMQVSPSIAPANSGTASRGGSFSSVQILRSGLVNKQGLLKTEYLSYVNWNASTVANLPVVRTHDDVLLLGNLSHYTSYSWPNGTAVPYYMLPADAGSKVSLAVIDYTGNGTGMATPNTTIFAQRATRGSVSWL